MKYEKEELEKLIKIEKMPYEAIGRIYGVTGTAIKKAALRLGIELEKKRKINPNENFSHPRKCKFDIVSDEEFKDIIKTSTGWKEICKNFGYNSIINKESKDRILKRCESLDIKINLIKLPEVLSRTKGELLSDRKNYQSYRSTVRKWAEKIYKEYNSKCECIICGYNKHIEIAHIKAVSDFDDNATIAQINNIDNLVGLCPNHHWEFDNNCLSEEDKNIIYRRMEELSISPVS